MMFRDLCDRNSVLDMRFGFICSYHVAVGEVIFLIQQRRHQVLVGRRRWESLLS